MTRVHLAPLALAFTLALGAPRLAAGDRPLIGGAVHLNLPMADLNSDARGRVGWGAAFQVAVDLGRGHQLRPRLDVDTYRVKGSFGSGSDHQESIDLTGVGLGVDYLYAFGGRKEAGLYALAGLGVKRWSVDYGSYDRQGDTVTTVTTDARRRTSLEASLGLGYQVKAWFGLEARYTHSRYEGAEGLRLFASTPTTPGASREAGAIQLGATFRW